MKYIISFLFIVICQSVYSQAAEEFTGPFASWANVKSRFGAKGDGRSDDTRALQTAIDSLTCSAVLFNYKDRAYTVIYLPKGTYKISSTLNFRGKIGIQIIGEDPENTRLLWSGAENDTMLLANGSAYFKISRLTWDANNIKGTECIGLHWKEKWNIPATKDAPGSRSFASLYNEFSDLVFTGKPAIGISGGTTRGGPSPGTASNDSEITIRRCTFIQCTVAGVKISGFNALEYWIWHSKFIQCNTGVDCNSGNYHLYYSYFQQSAVADISNNQGYYTSARFCYSEGSKAFSIDAGASSNPFKRTFQGNIIKDFEKIPIQYTHVGRITLLDNEISNSTDPMNKVMVTQKSWAPASYQMLSVGNKYGNSKAPLRIVNAKQKIYAIGDGELLKPSIVAKEFLKKMPLTPVITKRKIFEVPAGADDIVIQQIINEAAKLKGSRPVVHFPYGQYTLNKTVVIPQGADMQLIGDGLRYSTTIKFGKPDQFKGKSLFKIYGPSYITIRDLQLGTFVKFKWKALEFEETDQPGSYVKMDQIYTIADTCLFINGLNYSYFEKNNSFFADGNTITGGPFQKNGKGTLKVHAFGGQYANTEVTNNAAFVSKDCWWEGRKKVPLYFKGDGQITIDGAKIAPHAFDSMPIIVADKFKGKISLMNMYVQGSVSIMPDNPDLKFLLWNGHMFFKKDVLGGVPETFKGQIAMLGLTGQCMYKDDPYCAKIWSVDNKTINVKNEDLFLEEMLKQTREAIPRNFEQRSQGASSIYISRVLFDTFEIALQFNQ